MKNSLNSKLKNIGKTRKKLLTGMASVTMIFSSLLVPTTSVVHAEENNKWEEIEKVLNKDEATKSASITKAKQEIPDGFVVDNSGKYTFFILELNGDNFSFNKQAGTNWYIRLSRDFSTYDGIVYADLVNKDDSSVVESLVIRPGENKEFQQIKSKNIAAFNFTVKVDEATMDVEGKNVTSYFIGIDSGMGGGTKSTIRYSSLGTENGLRLNNWSGVVPRSPIEQRTMYLKKEDDSLLAQYTQSGGIYGFNFTSAGPAKFENYELVEEPEKKDGVLDAVTPGTYVIDDRFSNKRARIKINTKEDGTQKIAMLIINPDHPNFEENYNNSNMNAEFLDIVRLRDIVMNSNLQGEQMLDEFNKTNPNYLLMYVSQDIAPGAYNESQDGVTGTGRWEYTLKEGDLTDGTKTIIGEVQTLDGLTNAFFTVGNYTIRKNNKEYKIAGLESGMKNSNNKADTDIVYRYAPKGGLKVFFVNTKGEQIKDPAIVYQKADKGTRYNTADVKENIIPFGGKKYRFKAIDPEGGVKEVSAPAADDSRQIVEITEEEGSVETNTIKELTYVYEELNQSLTVEKSVAESKYSKVGDVLHYTVVITNTGDEVYDALDIRDSLVDFAKMDITESKTNDNKLEVGENWILNYEYTVTEDDITAGKVINKVTVKDPQNPDDPGEEGQTETPKEKFYKVTHEYKSGTPNKELPQEVKDLTPKNQENKKNGEDVTPTPPEKTTVAVKDGEWVFEDYDRETGRIENKDEHFVGTWVFKETPKQKIGNVYVKYITEDGQELEAEKPVKVNAPIGEGYTTDKKNFNGYEFVKMESGSAPGNGEVTETDQYVVYVYRKVNTTNEKPIVLNNNNNNSNNGGTISVSSPKTGDSSNILLYSGISVVSLASVAVILYKKRTANK